MTNTTRKETKERKRKQAEERNAAFQALSVEEKCARNPKKANHYQNSAKLKAWTEEKS